MSIQDGYELWVTRHTPTAKRPVTFEDVASNQTAQGQLRYRARHGDTEAQQLLDQVTNAYAALQAGDA